MSIRNNVERWLIHESYSFNETKSDDDIFKMTIKHVGGFGNPVEIFEPKSQPNVLVIGSKVALKNNQNARFLKLNDDEKKNFEKKVEDYCYSLQAVHRFIDEDGKKKIGVYIVLDKEEQLNQNSFFEAMQRVVEMSEKMTKFLMKTF